MLRYVTSNKAFSLLEVILAVAILSVGIVSILQAFSFSARVTGLSLDMIRAVFLSEDKLQEIEFKEISGKLDQVPQQFNEDEGRFNIQYSISQLAATTDLYQLDFGINWNRSGRQESITISTLLRK